MRKWTTSNIPDIRGRSFVVTGTGGLGFEDALALARAGATVILAGRNPGKGADAVARIKREAPKASISFEVLDLADLASIAAFGERLRSQNDHLDVLINNAGVMMPPTRKLTPDGFELQFGTNYLGHFALTAHLLSLLRKGRNPRVVTLSSIAARDGRIAFDDLQATHDYKSMPVYSQSKLACLMFALEFQRRSEAGHWGVTSIAAHPGISRTDLLPNGTGASSIFSIARRVLWFLFQPAAQGALPTLFAATSPEAKGGGYYGPDRLSETRGYPTAARIPPAALDREASARLWDISEKLTHVRFG
ncbi:SDR family oxidoreductase [Komagataeibacter diospyri]|uniref:Oxidoreductase n=1 Tax=Komagataeibacter diospyri TaxID=1932662 RepID=A0A4P5NUC4_9PROT|nr:SDR family oxidoreductase [Komagataeibacter diospyri]GCE85249.1 oxidoreductase [Komagataeibacter diospyri]